MWQTRDGFVFWILRWRLVYTSRPAYLYFRKGGQCANTSLKGLKQVKKTDLNARFLFLSPPSLEILEERLRGRGTDKEEDIQQRLAQAKNEMDYAQTPGVHDKTIVNNDLEKAWQEFREFCVPADAQ